MQWLHQSVSDFTSLTKRNSTDQNRDYVVGGSRTERCLRRFTISQNNRPDDDSVSLPCCKDNLRYRIMLSDRGIVLSRRDDLQRLRFYVDASDETLAGLVTHVPNVEMNKQHWQSVMSYWR